MLTRALPALDMATALGYRVSGFGFRVYTNAECADAASWDLASDFNGVAEVGDARTCGGALSGQGGPACLFGIKT